MVDLTQAHKASIELLGTRHTALVEAVRNYINGSVQPSIDELIAAVDDVTTDIDTKEKMLLGLASRQATKPVPSLILDFKTRHYLQGTRRPEKGYGIHDLLTVERASPKWVFNASGKLVEVPAHEPAYQHDPVTGEPLGLLIEESRTNLLTYSEQFGNSSWSTVGTITQNATTSPDGTMTADKYVERPASVQQRTLKNLSVDTGVYTASAFFKQAERPFAYLRFFGKQFYLDFASGVVEGYGGSTETLIDYGAEECDGGWWRVFATMECITGTRGSDIHFGCGIASEFDGFLYEGDGTSGVYIWGAQLEEGPLPSSYIPTTDSPVTRAADNVSRNLGEEFNPSEGTFFVAIDGSTQKENQIGLSISDSGYDNRMELRYTGTPGVARFTITTDGASTTTLITLGADTPDRRLALSYADGIITCSVNGESNVFSASVNGAALTKMEVGRGSYGANSILNGSVLNAYYYPLALTEAELIEVTSL